VSFSGKVAIVTGASSGIGKCVAELYAKEGAAVILSDINEASGEKTAEQIRLAGGKACFIPADLSESSACRRMVEAALEKFGRLDYACNNAGIGGENNPTADYSLEGWQQIIAINLSGVFYCMKYEIPAMLQTGGGAIVNMASVLGQVGIAGAPGYVAAKHGVVGLTKNAAIEYAAHNIRINAVAPAFISSTRMTDKLEGNPKVQNFLSSLHPMKRLGKPEEVAGLVIWLSSEKASFVTGACLPVDGGYLAR